jgi:hypothetical protein
MPGGKDAEPKTLFPPLYKASFSPDFAVFFFELFAFLSLIVCSLLFFKAPIFPARFRKSSIFGFTIFIFISSLLQCSFLCNLVATPFRSEISWEIVAVLFALNVPMYSHGVWAKFRLQFRSNSRGKVAMLRRASTIELLALPFVAIIYMSLGDPWALSELGPTGMAFKILPLALAGLTVASFFFMSLGPAPSDETTTTTTTAADMEQPPEVVDEGQIAVQVVPSTPPAPVLIQAASTPTTPQRRARPNLSAFPVIRFSELEIGPVIGSGSRSVVFEGIWMGLRVAMARAEGPSSTLELMERIGSNCPAVPQLLGVCLQGAATCTVQERLLGSLDRHLEALSEEGKAMSTRECLDVIRQVAEALILLHHKHIFGVTLTPAKVLLASLVPLRVKLAPSIGSNFRAAAPELLASPEPRSTARSDVFALGVLAWQILTGNKDVPWGADSTRTEVSEAVAAGQRLPKASVPDQIFSALLVPMWSEVPDDRPDLPVVLTVVDDLLPLVAVPSAAARHQQRGGFWECPVCYESTGKKFAMDGCGHIFCERDANGAADRGRCHLCNASFKGQRPVFF